MSKSFALLVQSFHHIVKMSYIPYVIGALLLCSNLATSQESPNLSVYGNVPGLSASPYYSFRVKEHESEKWLDTFALVTECTLEKYCNTTGFYENLRDWSNTYINFEMKSGAQIDIEITKLEGAIAKAVVHPIKAAQQCTVQDGKAIVSITETGLFTVDINGQMDDQDTGLTPEGQFYDGPPIHTLTIFANPFIEDKPSLEDDGVWAVAPGEYAPSEGDWHTLYFMPGLHDIGLNFPLHKEWFDNYALANNKLTFITIPKVLLSANNIIHVFTEQELLFTRRYCCLWNYE